VKRKKKATRP